MNARSALALLALFLHAGCQDERDAGTTTETENAVAVRAIRIDSAVAAADLPSFAPFVATLRFDESSFDFAQSADSGLDLDVRTPDSVPIPFEIVHWDRAARRGRLHVRIAGKGTLPGAQVLLFWRLPRAHRSDPAATWAGITDSQKLLSTSALVDDFESGSTLHNRLPYASFWFVGGSIPTSGLADAGSGRDGNAFRLNCNAGQCDTGRVLLAATLLANSPRCFRSLDSVVFWARGKGRVRLAFEGVDSAQMQLIVRGRLDSLQPRRAWCARPLDTAWKRIAIRPSEFDAADGRDGNVGWSALRDSVNYVTFLIEGGSELWLDDIRLHGVAPGDLR